MITLNVHLPLLQKLFFCQNFLQRVKSRPLLWGCSCRRYSNVSGCTDGRMYSCIKWKVFNVHSTCRHFIVFNRPGTHWVFRCLPRRVHVFCSWKNQRIRICNVSAAFVDFNYTAVPSWCTRCSVFCFEIISCCLLLPPHPLQAGIFLHIIQRCMDTYGMKSWDLRSTSGW